MELQQQIYRIGTEDRIRNPLTDSDFLARVSQGFKDAYGIVCAGLPGDRWNTTIVAVCPLTAGLLNREAFITQGRVDFRKIMKRMARGLIVRKGKPHENLPKYQWVIEFHRDQEFLGGTFVNLTYRPTVLSILDEFILKGISPNDEEPSYTTLEQATQVVALDEELRQQITT